MATALPVHPRTGLRALGVMPSGRIVWPILGAEDNPDNPTQPPPAADDAAFPANTPVAEMNAQQQAAYWRDKARKHEDRVKAYGGITPERLAELQAAAEQLDVLTAASRTDQERAVAEARRAVETELAAKYRPALAAAEVRAAAAGRVPTEQLTKALEFVDTTKFLAEDGSVDTAKVTAFVEGIAPPAPQRSNGPSSSGLGNRGNNVQMSAKEQAAEQIAKRFPSAAAARS